MNSLSASVYYTMFEDDDSILLFFEVRWKLIILCIFLQLLTVITFDKRLKFSSYLVLTVGNI